MAKTILPTNYVDDVLNGAMDGKRRYREIPNADGTISLEDATAYDQIGSNFGAAQLNLMSENINQSFDSGKMLKTMAEVNAVTQEGYGVDALVVKHVNNSLGGVTQFVVDDSTGKIAGYKTEIGGADTVFPFSGGGLVIPEITLSGSGTGYNVVSGSGKAVMMLNVEEQTSISFETVTGNATIQIDSDIAQTLSSGSLYDISNASKVTITATGSDNASQAQGGSCTATYSVKLNNIIIK